MSVLFELFWVCRVVCMVLVVERASVVLVCFYWVIAGQQALL
jgi:hypothetical protein